MLMITSVPFSLLLITSLKNNSKSTLQSMYTVYLQYI